MIRLSVNIDHFATLREARGGSEPDPISGALISELAGAQGIVCHLREDRRHINDRDARLIRELIQTRMDLEMAAVKEIIDIALEILPDLVTIVPEKRQELTTEGGLNVTDNQHYLKSVIDLMHEKEILVSLFVEPDKATMDIASSIGADMVELHTGKYANLRNEKDVDKELNRIRKAAEYASSLGMKVAAGHGLNYQNVAPICMIPEIEDISIGHSIIARALYVGIDRAVKEMLEIINHTELFREAIAK